MDDDETFILDCMHCGNKVPMKSVGHHEEEIYDENEEDHEDWLVYTILHDMFECPTCKGITYATRGIFGPYPDEEPEVMYPSLVVDYTGVPKLIKTAFESAVKTKGIDSAVCVMALGRVLEMICGDKKAIGKGLDAKVNDLVKKKILPEMMKDVCDVIRFSRNLSAHETTHTFNSRDVEALIDYLASVINYTYSLPIRVGKHRERLMSKEKTIDNHPANDDE